MAQYISRLGRVSIQFTLAALANTTIGRTSSETRLVVTEKEQCRTKKYSHKDYEDIMFHFNTETRTTYWPHDVKADGIDHCYDCAAEICISNPPVVRPKERL